MRMLSLAWGAAQAAAMRPAWRAMVSLAPTPLPGLLARQWLLHAHAVQAQYLFSDDNAADAFLACPGADLAHARFQQRVGPALAEPAQVARGPAGAAPQQPIFIIAAPRSGSTLLFDLLAQAPGVQTQGAEGQGAVEGIVGLHPQHRGFGSDRLDETDLTPSVLACLQAGWGFGLRDRQGRSGLPPDASASSGRQRLLDKTTEHSLRVAFLARACPDARFVLLHRDARQNVSSLMQAWQHGGFSRWRELPGWPPHDWCFLLPPGWQALRGRSLQAVATAQWEAAQHWSLHDLEMLDAARWTCVDYNELVAQPAPVVERLCAFLDLDVDATLAAALSRPLPVSGTAISPPSAIKWRSNAGLDVAALEAATRVTSARLRSLHSLAPEPPPAAAPSQVVAAQARVRFSCPLAEVEPLWSEPGTDALAVRAVQVAPSFRLQLGSTIPLGMGAAARFRERFACEQPVVWTRDPFTQALRPYWVERQQARWFAALAPGEPPPPAVPALLARLRRAGIVASTAEHLAAEQQGATRREALAAAFAERGYCVVPGVLAPAHTRALAQYYRALVAAGGWRGGDAQVARRHGWHNESVARFFQHQLTGFIGALVGEPACASYAYVSLYQRGARLAPHVDRKQCEYTLSLVIEEQGGRSCDWPLHFLAGPAASAVTLNVGDAVLFRGHDLPHWREAPACESLSLSTLLFHYVPADFAETLH